MQLDINSKEYALIRVALADLIKKCKGSINSLKLEDNDSKALCNRYDETINTTNELLKKLS
jgi:hypothetical protein